MDENTKSGQKYDTHRLAIWRMQPTQWQKYWPLAAGPVLACRPALCVVEVGHFGHYCTDCATCKCMSFYPCSKHITGGGGTKFVHFLLVM